MVQLVGEISILKKYEARWLKNGLNQWLFKYLECNFVCLLGPTNSKVQAHLPSGNLMLCLRLYLLKPIYPGFLQKVPFSVVSQ